MKKSKGGSSIRWSRLDFSDEDTAFAWQEVLDMINLGDIPPEKAPPSNKETKAIVSWITGNLEEAYALHAEEAGTISVV